MIFDKPTESARIGNPDERCIERPQPGRLWSLWEMYDFQLREFHSALSVVAKAHEATRGIEMSGAVGPLSKKQCDDYIQQFEDIAEFCKRMDFVHTERRVLWMLKRLRERTMTGPHLRSDTASIHEAMIDDASGIVCYHYPPDRADLLLKRELTWREAFDAFPSAKEDIVAGIDLYALGHATASVFHMMRAAEIALRALARERRVSIGKGRQIEWATWGVLLQKIEDKVAEIRRKPNGPKKDAALEFYSGALGHMTALKDKYRDQANHVRRSYDDHEARSAIDHTRECINALATRLNEKSTRAIAWGL